MKRMLILKLPPFFPCRVGEGKRAAISKQTCFSQKRVRSYIVLALVVLWLDFLIFFSMQQPPYFFFEKTCQNEKVYSC